VSGSDFDRLARFVAVTDWRSFSRGSTARRGPSAQSYFMRQRSDRVGMRRLNRTTRSVSVTCVALDCSDAIRGHCEDR